MRFRAGSADTHWQQCGDSPTHVIVVELKVAPPMHSVLMVNASGGRGILPACPYNCCFAGCPKPLPLRVESMNVPVEARTGMPTLLHPSMGRSRRSAQRPLAVRGGLAAAAPGGRCRRHHEGRHCLSACLRGDGAVVARRLPERTAVAQAVSGGWTGCGASPGGPASAPGPSLRSSRLSISTAWRRRSARILGMLLIPFESDFGFRCAAPEVATACSEAGLSQTARW